MATIFEHIGSFLTYWGKQINEVLEKPIPFPHGEKKITPQEYERIKREKQAKGTWLSEREYNRRKRRK